MFRLAAVPLAAILLLTTANKIRMYEKEGSFHVDTPDNAGDVVMDGESLNGLFAIVEGLQAKVDMLMGVTTTTTTTTTETTTTTTTTTTTHPPLLTDAEMDGIKGWVKTDFSAFQSTPVEDIVAERCYSTAASGDGGAAAGFHAGCDGNEHTITVVKMLNGNLFGGVTDKDWGTTPQHHYQSDVTFLFCIKCAGSTSGAMEQLKVIDNRYAIYAAKTHGPTFGANFDMHLSDMALQNSGSYSSLTQCPASRTGTCQQYLAGDWTNGGTAESMVAGYEVYALK